MGRLVDIWHRIDASRAAMFDVFEDGRFVVVVLRRNRLPAPARGECSHQAIHRDTVPDFARVGDVAASFSMNSSNVRGVTA